MAKDKIELHDFQVLSMKYKTQLNKMFLNRKKWEKPDQNQIMAFIPGTIREIYVKKGKKVKEGDKLLVLEAMKMRNTVYAPFDGKIISINVKEGQVVPKKHLMIEIKP